MSARKRPLLYGPNGKPLPTASGWDSSGTGVRAKSWNPTTANINALIASDGETIRRRSHDEIRRNPWAAKAKRTFVANVVGGGILPKPRTVGEAFKEELQEAWHEWGDEADADGASSLSGLQALWAGALYEGGDCIVRRRPRRPSDGLSVPLQLQTLEADMLDDLQNRPLGNGRVVKAGIQFDIVARRTHYWLYREHPGEAVWAGSGFQSVPVPADQIAHLFEVSRPSQVRGVAMLAPVLALLHEIRELDDAHLLRAKIQNLYATFEEIPTEDSGSVLDDPSGAAAADTDEDDVPTVTAAAASHVLLPPGHKVSYGKPPTGALDFAALLKDKLRAVASGARATYEQITGNLEGVNFTSIRAGLLELHRELEQLQMNVIVFQGLRRVWRWWFEAAVLSGRIVLPEEERPFASRLLRPRWQPPGWPWVQPEREVVAAVKKIRAGLSSREIETAKLGIDVEELDRGLAAERKREKRLSLIFDSNAAYTSASGVAHTEGELAALEDHDQAEIDAMDQEDAQDAQQQSA